MSQINKEFAGKTIFVTGAAKGQGRAVSLAFAEEGANIIAFDLGETIPYRVLYRCLEDWDGDGYTVGASDSPRWQMKICGQRSCLRTVCGTVEPPHGAEMKKILAGIIGEENCRLF